MTVEQSEYIFEKIDEYYQKDLIKLIDNILDEYPDDNSNQIQEREIKMLIPITLEFTLEELKEFKNEEENQFILLDFFKNELGNLPYSKPPIFDVKIDKGNYEIICKYETVRTRLEIINEIKNEKEFERNYIGI